MTDSHHHLNRRRRNAGDLASIEADASDSRRRAAIRRQALIERSERMLGATTSVARPGHHRVF
jgi:hypothetical protein